MLSPALNFGNSIFPVSCSCTKATAAFITSNFVTRNASFLRMAKVTTSPVKSKLFSRPTPISRDSPPDAPRSPQSLSRHVHSPLFPDDRHLDLARIGHFRLDFLGNLKAQLVTVHI